MSFLTPLPPLFPRLTYQIPTCDNDQDPSYSIIPTIPVSQNQNQRNRRNSQDNKYISDIDREEDALHAQNIRIAIHGQLYLRPPGLDPYVPPGYYTDQEQQGTPPQMDETFVQDEDEEGFVLSEEEEEEGDEDEFEDELAEEEEQDLDADIEQPSDASYLTLSPDATPNEGGVVYGDTFGGQESPTTPSAGGRGPAVLEALSHLLDAVGSSRGEMLPEDVMSLEEEEEDDDDLIGEDLDADVEDMDEDLESSLVEEDSMDL